MNYKIVISAYVICSPETFWMKMNNLHESKNNSSKVFSSVIMIYLMITLSRQHVFLSTTFVDVS